MHNAFSVADLNIMSVIGIDFDNTLVDYTGIFHEIAVEQKLVPRHVGQSKTDVRDYLRDQDREDDWTRLQGLVYGSFILRARPYSHALESLSVLALQGPVYLVSHKTRYPYLGPKVDLHHAARNWLEHYGLCGTDTRPLFSDIFFEETRHDKIQRILSLDCSCFVDDLPELLLDPELSEIDRILFDPTARHQPGNRGYRVITSWLELAGLFT